MAFCSNCGNQLPEGTTFCANCGAPVGAPQQAAPVMPVAPVAPAYDPADHTAEFDPQDISDNKVLAMTPYILSTVGIIIALLAGQQSPYVMFHARQALKLDIVTILLGIVTAILAWTIIVPIAGAIAIVVLMVIRIIAFFQVCKGQAKEPAIIKNLSFLK